LQKCRKADTVVPTTKGETMYDLNHMMYEEVLEHRGYTATLTMWSDYKWTAFISGKQAGAEHVVMDADIVWEERPDEDKIQEYIDEALEG